MPRVRKPSETRLDSVRRHLIAMRDPETAELPPILALRALAAEVDPPGASIAWLAAYDPARQVREAAGMALFLAAQDPAVPPGLRRRIARSATPWLLEGLHDPDVPDDRKYPLGPILGLFGLPVSEECYRACFRDLDAVRAQKAREAMRQILDRPDHMERVLDGLERAEDDPHDAPGLEAALEVAVAICEHNASVGALLAGVLVATAHERGLELELVPRALELVAATKCGRAAWVLGELGRWPALRETGDRARELSMALNELGIPSQPARPGSFSHGFVGPVDGTGSRRLALFFRTDEGTLHGLLLRLSDVEGVADVGCVFHERSALDEALRRTEPSLVPCDLAHARHLLGDALAVHEETDQAPPGRLLLHRSFLGPEPIAVDHREPRLGAYLLETLVPSPALVVGSEALAGHAPYADLWSGSREACAEVVRRARPRASARRASRSVSARRRALGLALAAAMTDGDRAALVRRLAVNLEHEARAGRARLAINRLAARVWLVLSEGIVPFDDVPYVRALCERAALKLARDVEGRGGVRRAGARR